MEKRFSDDLDIEDAIHTAILTLKDSFEGELTDRNVEIGVIRTSDPNKEFKILTASEIKDYLREVEWGEIEYWLNIRNKEFIYLQNC